MPGDAGFLPSAESFQNFNPRKLPADPLWPEIRFISLTDQSCHKCNFQRTCRDGSSVWLSGLVIFLQMRHVRWELDRIRKSETGTRKLQLWPRAINHLFPESVQKVSTTLVPMTVNRTSRFANRMSHYVQPTSLFAPGSLYRSTNFPSMFIFHWACQSDIKPITSNS